MTTKQLTLITAKSLSYGSGQVMFQQNVWTGVLFLAGIFWGSYASGSPLVAWGAVVGLIASTLSGYIIGDSRTDGQEGLWGFNGILVGCAFPTFLGSSWQMWVALIICAAATTWVRRGFNNVMAPWGVNSFTFPFVFLTWIFMLAAKEMPAMQPVSLSTPELAPAFSGELDMSIGSLAIYWLKGIAQVFLVDSWVTGIFFLVALAASSLWAAAWAAIASAIALIVAIAFKADPTSIASGLYGFSAVLTGIALGCTFYKPGLKSALWCIAGIVVTMFIQAGMDAVLLPLGIPSFTGPFCLATWLFLLPRYTWKNKSDTSK